MKECPRCHLQFPDTANFCPMDREKLVTIKEDAGAVAAKKKRFSETQWFMASTNVDELQDTTLDDRPEEITAKYSRNVDVPEDVRSKYSIQAKEKNRATGSFYKEINEAEAQLKSSKMPIVIAIIIGVAIGAGVAVYLALA